MKRILSLTALFVLLLGVQWASADVVSPYKMTFDDLTSSDLSDWQFTSIGPGWKHVISSGEGSYFHQNYSVKTIDGTDKGLYFETDHKMNGWDYEDITDNFIITPAVSGTVTLKIKADYASTSSALTIYKWKDGVKGDAVYTNTKPENTDWTVITIADAADNEQFAIHGKQILVNDFEAGSADVTLKPGIAITALTDPTSNKSVDVNSEGTYTFTYVVSIKNDGDIDLTATELEGKTLSVVNAATNAVVGSVDLATVLADGLARKATKTGIEIPVTIKYTDCPDAAQYNVVENISYTTFTGRTITPVPYAPVMKLYNGTAAIEDASTLPFGKMNADKTVTLTLKNEGAKALNILSTSVTGKFETDLTTAVEMAAHGQKDVNITAKATDQGDQTGAFVITFDKGDGTQGTFTVNLSSSVIDPEKWFVDFEDNKVPSDMMEGDMDGMHKGYTAKRSTAGNTWWYDGGYYQGQLTSPLLEVAEGDVLAFDIKGKKETSSITVSYSTDRLNWTEATVINKDNQMTVYAGDYSYTNICEDVKVTTIPAGKYYVKFVMDNSFIDNIYGFKKADVAHDWMIKSVTVPETSNVNAATTVTAVVNNMLDKVEEADSYTASLYVNGEKVAESATPKLSAKGNASYSFTFTPHATGNASVYVEFAEGDYKMKSDESTITINEESAANDVKIGEKYDQQRCGLNLYYTKSESELIYTAEQLAGKVAAGQKITKIAFTGKAASYTCPLKVWMGATTDNAPQAAAGTRVNTEGLTEVLNEEAHAFTAVSAGTILEITLDEPYVYTGGNLKICMLSDAESGYNSNIYFDVTNINTQAITRYNDNSLDKSVSKSNYLPVLILGVANDPATFSGVVTDKKTAQPVKNAVVTLKSGDIEYTATTDEEGKYSVNVIKSNLTYDVTYVADGYATETLEDVDVTETSESNVEMQKGMAVTVDFGDDDYATVTLPFSADIPEGMKCYSITGVDNDNNVVASQNATIQANTPYLLKKESTASFTEYTFKGEGEVSDSWYTTTWMAGTTADNNANVGDYVLQNLNGVLAFYKVNSAPFAIPAFRAVIRPSKPLSAKSLNITISDATAINAVATDGNAMVDVYNIQGMKVRTNVKASEATKGLSKGMYIINGKKVLVK